MKEPYKLIVNNGKIVREHRVVMSNHLGRELSPDEIIHHKNENCKDNRIENLQVMTRGEHNRLHTNTTAEEVYITCPICKQEFKRKLSYINRRIRLGTEKFFCSRACTQVSNRNPRSRFIPNLDCKIKEGLILGYSGYRIAKEAGVHKNTVYNRLKEMNNIRESVV